MRNFYLEADIDGRKTNLTGGPSSKDGGFSLDIFMRSENKSEKVLNIAGTSINDDLYLTVKDIEPANKDTRRYIFTIATKR